LKGSNLIRCGFEAARIRRIRIRIRIRRIRKRIVSAVVIRCDPKSVLAACGAGIVVVGA
jgi:hypothetical protein